MAKRMDDAAATTREEVERQRRRARTAQARLTLLMAAPAAGEDAEAAWRGVSEAAEDVMREAALLARMEDDLRAD